MNQKKRKFPESWTSVNLFRICSPKQWSTLSTKDLLDNGYAVYGANGRIGYYSNFTHEFPTILITCRGATCGKLNISVAKSWVNGNAMALDELNTDVTGLKFLYFTLLNRGFSDVISGSAQPQITREKLKLIEVSIPPLAEQHRIVAKIESLQERSRKAREALLEVGPLLEQFRQSLLAAAFRGDLTADWRAANPDVEPASQLLERIRQQRKDTSRIRGRSESLASKELLVEIEALPLGWNWVSIGDIASLINGDRGSNYPNQHEYVQDGIPFINTGHIEPDGSLSTERMNFITREKFDSLGGGKIKEGDLVYCLRGATLGKTAKVSPYNEGAIASSLVVIRPLGGNLTDFLYYYLISQIGRNEIRKYINGSAQPNLAAASVMKFMVPLPPQSEIDAIVKALNNITTSINKFLLAQRVLIGSVDLLDQSILAKAFRGELVPQDPNDEPASVLLERIRSAREEPAKSTKKVAKTRTSKRVENS